MAPAVPTVHFLCVQRPANVRMALGFFDQLAAGQALAWATVQDPELEVRPSVIAAMAELGVNISAQPERLAPAIADVVVAMSSGGDRSLFLARRYEDWNLTEAAGTVAEVRPVRDEIERRVRMLLSSLDVRAIESSDSRCSLGRERAPVTRKSPER